MRHYYRLIDAMDTHERWHIGRVYGPGETIPWLTGGVRLDPERSLHTPIKYFGPVPDFSETSFGVPIAVDALARAIQSVAGADVQCLPVDIEQHAGFMALNAVRVVRCVDEDRSDFTRWTTEDARPDLAGQYHHISPLVVDPRRIPEDAHFFRVEAWLVGLIVSDAVKAAMERAGCAGAKFIDVNPDAGTPSQ